MYAPGLSPGPHSRGIYRDVPAGTHRPLMTTNSASAASTTDTRGWFDDPNPRHQSPFARRAPPSPYSGTRTSVGLPPAGPHAAAYAREATPPRPRAWSSQGGSTQNVTAPVSNSAAHGSGIPPRSPRKSTGEHSPVTAGEGPVPRAGGGAPSGDMSDHYEKYIVSTLDRLETTSNELERLRKDHTEALSILQPDTQAGTGASSSRGDSSGSLVSAVRQYMSRVDHASSHVPAGAGDTGGDKISTDQKQKYEWALRNLDAKDAEIALLRKKVLDMESYKEEVDIALSALATTFPSTRSLSLPEAIQVVLKDRGSGASPSAAIEDACRAILASVAVPGFRVDSRASLASQLAQLKDVTHSLSEQLRAAESQRPSSQNEYTATINQLRQQLESQVALSERLQAKIQGLARHSPSAINEMTAANARLSAEVDTLQIELRAAHNQAQQGMDNATASRNALSDEIRQAVAVLTSIAPPEPSSRGSTTDDPSLYAVARAAKKAFEAEKDNSAAANSASSRLRSDVQEAIARLSAQLRSRNLTPPGQNLSLLAVLDHFVGELEKWTEQLYNETTSNGNLNARELQRRLSERDAEVERLGRRVDEQHARISNMRGSAESVSAATEQELRYLRRKMEDYETLVRDVERLRHEQRQCRSLLSVYLPPALRDRDMASAPLIEMLKAYTQETDRYRAIPAPPNGGHRSKTDGSTSARGVTSAGPEASPHGAPPTVADPGSGVVSSAASPHANADPAGQDPALAQKTKEEEWRAQEAARDRERERHRAAFGERRSRTEAADGTERRSGRSSSSGRGSMGPGSRRRREESTHKEATPANPQSPTSRASTSRDQRRNQPRLEPSPQGRYVAPGSFGERRSMVDASTVVHPPKAAANHHLQRERPAPAPLVPTGKESRSRPQGHPPIPPANGQPGGRPQAPERPAEGRDSRQQRPQAPDDHSKGDADQGKNSASSMTALEQMNFNKMGGKVGQDEHFHFTQHYEIGKQLGYGTFATVHTCRNRRTSTHAAVKIIDKNQQGGRFVRSFQREVEILKIVSHRFIVKLTDLYESDETIYIVTELMNGGDVLARLEQHGRYSERDARIVIKKVLEATSYLHSKGIIHRDLKPENILLATDRSATDIKICDFGHSALGKDDIDGFGTYSYLAPEVITTQKGGKSADLWSIGVILYVLLSGTFPFDSNDEQRMFSEIVHGDYSFPNSHWRHISPSAKDLITCLMTVDPNRRHTIAQALRHPWLAGVKV